MSNQSDLLQKECLLLLGTLLLGLLPLATYAADCTYREDTLGHTRYQCDDGKQGTLREDSLGNLRASDGTVCRTNAQGQLKCSGASLPPVLLGNDHQK